MTDTTSNVDPDMQTITAQRGHVAALAFARKAGVGLGHLLGAVATAKAVERKGPVQVMLYLSVEFDAAVIPMPGSTKAESGNMPYDKYTAEVDTDQGKKKIPGSWVTDVTRAQQEWIDADHRQSFCKSGAAAMEGCPDDIARMGDAARKEEWQRIDDYKKDMRKALVAGILLFKRVEEINTMLPEKIRVKLPIRQEYVIDPATNERVKDENGAFVTTDVVYGNTIRLQDPSGDLEERVLTVGQFQALKPDKIPAGTEVNIIELEKTGTRAPKQKGGKKTPGKIDVPLPQTVEQLLNHFNILSTALDTKTEEGSKLLSKLLAACAVEGKSGDDTVETTGDFLNGMDDLIWTVINARYNLIKTNKNKAANLAAAQPDNVKRATG